MTVKTIFLASLYIFGYMVEPGLGSGKFYFQNGKKKIKKSKLKKIIYIIFCFQILATKRPPKAPIFSI
jgi:hypothetical protein